MTRWTFLSAVGVSIVGVVMVFHDITERRQADAPIPHPFRT